MWEFRKGLVLKVYCYHGHEEFDSERGYDGIAALNIVVYNIFNIFVLFYMNFIQIVKLSISITCLFYKYTGTPSLALSSFIFFI